MKPARAVPPLVVALLASGLALPPVQAATNTPAILTDTISAIPSCLKWQPTGVCQWLTCSVLPPKCTLKMSFRVRHYVPDTIVSTFHEPMLHPWADFGRVVAVASATVGSAIVALPLDSAGSSTRSQEQFQSRDADAIANPVGMLAYLAAGGKLPDLPNWITLPSHHQLAAFPGSMNSILDQWAAVPQQVGQVVTAEAKAFADLPGKIAKIGNIANLANTISEIPSALGKLKDLSTNGLKIADLPTKIIDVDLSSFSTLIEAIGAGPFISTAVFCPGAGGPFGVHYQSTIDGLFWRGIVPVEMLYPGSWIPGIAEVGSGFTQTWGGVYPRTNDLYQVQGVKASAVLATRVASIIQQGAQPHIYAPLQVGGGGFRYFEAGGAVRWQRLYPHAQHSCGTFGANDALSLTSWGDGNTSSEEGYVWNMWRRYECCQRNGQIYLGTVPLPN